MEPELFLTTKCKFFRANVFCLYEQRLFTNKSAGRCLAFDDDVAHLWEAYDGVGWIPPSLYAGVLEAMRCSCTS